MIDRRSLWSTWVVLVFGLFNVYGPSLQSYRAPGDPPGISADTLARRLDPLQFFSVLVRNDGDAARYFSYANAMLGRPYATYYVRGMEEWTLAPDGAQDPGAFPTVAPPRPLLPWRDFSMEYPPGMAIFALLPALLTRDFDLYHRLFGLEMELLLTLSVFCAVQATERLAPGQGARTLAFALATTAALGFIAARRFDACVSASLGLTFWALAAGRPAGAGAALAFGVVAKGAPILFAPLGAIFYARTGRWRELFASLKAAGAVCLVAGLAFLALAGDHWRDAFAYHGARPLQIESTWSAALILLAAAKPSLVSGSVYTFGSDNLVSAYEPLLRPLAETAPLLAILAVCCWLWRTLRQSRGEFDRFVALAKAVCVVVVAFSALGKVFSPQYLVWLTPVAAIASLQSTRAAKASLLAGLFLTQLEYPFFYTFFAADLPPIFGLLALTRNLALMFWAAQLLSPPQTRPAVAAPAPQAA
ncbi:hypothetical protein [uncultured Rhodoblastus sp.]|uniref:hypothetical protein n=1 Tax=uncultured Rhodoblastus sp. TaxID=543037 RepID=UPI0025EE5C2E|nr:hypothetical protein [uncultured Rhodoblastus sp.]